MASKYIKKLYLINFQANENQDLFPLSFKKLKNKIQQYGGIGKCILPLTICGSISTVSYLAVSICQNRILNTNVFDLVTTLETVYSFAQN